MRALWFTQERIANHGAGPLPRMPVQATVSAHVAKAPVFTFCSYLVKLFIRPRDCLPAQLKLLLQQLQASVHVLWLQETKAAAKGEEEFATDKLEYTEHGAVSAGALALCLFGYSQRCSNLLKIVCFVAWLASSGFQTCLGAEAKEPAEGEKQGAGLSAHALASGALPSGELPEGLAEPGQKGVMAHAVSVAEDVLDEPGRGPLPRRQP